MKISAKKLKGKLWYLYKNPIDNLIVGNDTHEYISKVTCDYIYQKAITDALKIVAELERGKPERNE